MGIGIINILSDFLNFSFGMDNQHILFTLVYLNSVPYLGLIWRSERRDMFKRTTDHALSNYT